MRYLISTKEETKLGILHYLVVFHQAVKLSQLSPGKFHQNKKHVLSCDLNNLLGNRILVIFFYMKILISFFLTFVIF